MSYTPLDNPVWHALNEGHKNLAIGNGLARRYPADVASFVGLKDESEEAFEDLFNITAPGETVAVVSLTPPTIPANWQVVRQFKLTQMVYNPSHLAPAAPDSLTTLTPNDVPEMLGLVELTHPGPFFPRTIEMGNYFAICDGEKIAAMAGERFSLDGYKEISAVCTHPDYQKRGYGSQLINYLIKDNSKAGSLPFLHVIENNPAKKLYEALHFQQRRVFTLSVIQHA